MIKRCAALVLRLLFVALPGDPAASAQATDPHALYERRCARCHAPHAGEFVPDHLERHGDTIVGRRTGQELRSFLSAGHGRLSAGEIDVIVAHLDFILKQEALFREHCLICHGRAVDLARSQLVIRNGALMGRYTGREIKTFLEHHGRLKTNDVPRVVEMLERQLNSQSTN
ncbi:MAG: cytochrome c [Hyphomicrobiales bacterium]|nr:cytochrome c [Hyphomicrobiales bacterium]